MNKLLLLGSLLLLPLMPLLGHFYTPERLAFPALCEKHFHDPRKYTPNTWIEPIDSGSLKEFLPYLRYLPRPYEADCYGCSGCGGMRLSRREEFRLPFDNFKFAYDELHKLHQQVRYGTLETCRHRGADRCESFCWDGGYFRRMNSKYLPFFKEFLVYCSENNLCKCFWHERYQKAAAINNLVYRFLFGLAEQKLILPSFSPFWESKMINFSRKGRSFGKEYYPNSHGMAGSLTTYPFFYSQYHQMLLDVVASVEANSTDPLQSIVARDQVYNLLEELHAQFLPLYTHCLSLHPHPKIYYERSMLRLQKGQSQEALQDLHAFVNLAESDAFRSHNFLTSSFYQRLGETYTSLKSHQSAIEAFTFAIERDANNREAYFLRASAYFEIGNFEAALIDFLYSKKEEQFRQVLTKTSADFRDAVLKGLAIGNQAREAPITPSQRALWAFLPQSVTAEIVQNFANACDEMGRAYAMALQKAPEGSDISEDIKQLFSSYTTLGDLEKGEKMGVAIGKYGIALFASLPGIPPGIKQSEAFKKLQEANRLGNLFGLNQAEANFQALVALAAK